MFLTLLLNIITISPGLAAELKTSCQDVFNSIAEAHYYINIL